MKKNIVKKSSFPTKSYATNNKRAYVIVEYKKRDLKKPRSHGVVNPTALIRGVPTAQRNVVWDIVKFTSDSLVATQTA